ncbi:hypothetical protein [Marinobacter arenosus]|uniref:hypothetical protein n=1 Tax=Marinobacter arenosus TaxID=2856822 RepID=UPI001C4C73BD|nr:hypothetical protein [Marinobacter arenosus]MBW0149547.1 hypothetical protein [Marinobacter arenosus]
MGKIADLFNAAIHGGSRSFNSGENAILDAVEAELPESEREIFSKQRSAVNLVQRQRPGKLVVAYYGKASSVPEMPYQSYEYCLAEVWHNQGKQPRKTNVVLHNGLLQSLERSVPRSESEVREIVSVLLHPQSYQSLPEELDSEEHGNNA